MKLELCQGTESKVNQMFLDALKAEGIHPGNRGRMLRIRSPPIPAQQKQTELQNDLKLPLKADIFRVPLLRGKKNASYMAYISFLLLRGAVRWLEQCPGAR